MSAKESMGSVIVIYGGGLVDPAKFILLATARSLSRWANYDKVFVGRASFESLYKPDFWFEYGEALEIEVKKKRGSYFQTCREIDLSVEPRRSQAVATLKEANIKLVVVAGGDGSARQVAEMEEYFTENGICLVFAIPLTVDGINGGQVIGRRQAKMESIRQIENIASASLQTRDSEQYGVVIVELQGRNRDDILAGVINYFNKRGVIADIELDDMLLLAIPASIKSDIEQLVTTVKDSEKRTLILVSEGAKFKSEKLAWLIQGYGEVTRKVRSLVIGHPTQCNEQTTLDDKIEYGRWIDFVVKAIIENPGKSFSTSMSEDNEYKLQPLDYYAKLNPRDNQNVELPKADIELLKHYMTLG